MQFVLGFLPPSMLPDVRDRLKAALGPQSAGERPNPLSQLIKSVISARTYDEVAWAAFVRLRAAFPDWAALGRADPRRIETLIGTVTFADRKARQLPLLIRVLQLRPRQLDLAHLADMEVEAAMTWLQGLPGVSCKAAAATLNFSSLNRRALVVDTHVHRVVRRLGLVGRSALPSEAYAILMAEAPQDWVGDDLYELHWLLKRLSQSICTLEKPACGLCPFAADCPRVDAAVAPAEPLAFRSR